MNIFKVFTLWFKDKRGVLVALVLEILTLFLRGVAKELWEITTDEVAAAEASGVDGYRKWEKAYKGIRARLMHDDVPEWLVALAIECAVGVLQPKIPV